jgi:hypothetical protein
MVSPRPYFMVFERVSPETHINAHLPARSAMLLAGIFYFRCKAGFCVKMSA